MKKVIIAQSRVGLLYEDGRFVRTLEPGKHRLCPWWRLHDGTKRTVERVDIRERSLTIKGQEILTADKVAIRVSLLVYYKVTDPLAAAHNVESYVERIYEDVQLAARRFLASRDLEAILNDRNEISDTVRDEVQGAAASYGVEILRADVKDLVFPGNLREIMNQVLETERRAEAKLIEARKEAETLRIKAEAENENQMRKLEAERERTRVAAETERERLRVRLEAEIEEARSLRENPQLLQLRQMDVLRTMAKAGAKFVVGLETDGLSKLLSDDAK